MTKYLYRVWSDYFDELGIEGNVYATERLAYVAFATIPKVRAFFEEHYEDGFDAGFEQLVEDEYIYIEKMKLVDYDDEQLRLKLND